MSDVVLDANVLVGLLDQNDSLHQHATELLARMQSNGDQPVMLDMMVAEMVSALCRRTTQRKSVRQTSGVFAIRSTLGSKLVW
jgi:predicted nucleic acid-binding protein